MKQSYINEKSGIGYTLVGDVYLPNLVLPRSDYEIGSRGLRYLDYIKVHRRGFYTSLKMQCKLNEHLEERLTVKSLAEICGVSPDYLSQIFKREMGDILSSYILTRKLEYAKELIAKGTSRAKYIIFADCLL